MLYRVRLGCEDHFVEAAGFAEAVTKWRAAMIAKWKEKGWSYGDYQESDETIQPESVEHLGVEPVIR